MDPQLLAELAESLALNMPDALPQIEAHREDETFHDMCSEYEACARCLKGWKELGNQERIQEYQKLLDDLLVEILQFLEEHRD